MLPTTAWTRGKGRLKENVNLTQRVKVNSPEGLNALHYMIILLS